MSSPTCLPRFLAAHATQKFAQYPFVQFRTLDIERDPLEQGFEPHSFDLILASDVPACHAIPAQDARSCEATARFLRRPRAVGNHAPLALCDVDLRLLKGWWLFKDHDLRPDEPCLTQEQWKGLLHDAGFSATVCVADCPDPDIAPHSVILARGPQVACLAGSRRRRLEEVEILAAVCRRRHSGSPERGRRARPRASRTAETSVIEVTHGAEFRQAGSAFSIRAGNPDDMRRLMDERRQA